MGFLIFFGIPVGFILLQILLQRYLGNRIRSFVNGVGLIVILFWVFNSGNNDEYNVVENEQAESPKIENTTKVSINTVYSNQNNFTDNTEKRNQKNTRVNYNYNPNTYSKPIEKIETYKVRVGAVCNDGTVSTATGRGACSHHGGVAYWLYE